jgi:hypothetical protein
MTASEKSHIRKYQTFSDIGAVKKALERCGIAREQVDAQDYEHLRIMIERRHQIVHHADRNEDAQGRGNHRTRSIGRGHVTSYVAAVEVLRDFVSEELGAE